jgi:ABC-type lipoprotein release transport system permease subunit
MKLNNIFPIPIKSRTDLEIKEAIIKSSEYDPFQVMIGATQASSFGLRAGDSV